MTKNDLLRPAQPKPPSFLSRHWFNLIVLTAAVMTATSALVLIVVSQSEIRAFAAKGGGNNSNSASNSPNSNADGDSSNNGSGSSNSNSGGSSGNSGSIFTTNLLGVEVNQNIYATKDLVYLNGGPHNTDCGAAGLADGQYYFQVTDPSGRVLLSSDDLLQRKVVVTGGIISQYLGSTHAVGTGTCGSVTVALEPFNNTSNPGGEHKVWMTPVSQYDASNGAFGFSDSDSKKDSFKVLATMWRRRVNTTTISGMAFRDRNANGLNEGEPPMVNVPISLKDLNTGTTFPLVLTDAVGSFSFNNLRDGSYLLCENLPQSSPSWLQTLPTTTDHCYHITLSGGVSIDTRDFGSILLAEARGNTFLDLNINGMNDGEQLLPGFEFMLSGTSVTGQELQLKVISGDSGEYRFSDVMPGSYQICEMLPEATPAWHQTAPTSCHSLTLAEGEVNNERNFGNVQLNEISGVKFGDHNANAVRNAGDEGLQGFTVALAGTAADGSPVSQTAQTAADGSYAFASLLPGTYAVCETLPTNVAPAWLQTAPYFNGGCHFISVLSGQKMADNNFGNVRLADIRGNKFYDANANGTNDDNAFIGSWKVALAGTSANGQDVALATLTAAGGEYRFVNLLPGDYSVSEQLPKAGTYGVWAATTPLQSSFSASEGSINFVHFGNVCIGAGGGKSPGYWGNPNGQALVGNDDLTAMTALRLRNSSGANFDPTTYAALKTWIQGATSTNMAYMLSNHLAAVKLSVLNGLVDADQMVVATGADSANNLGYASVAAVMAEADAELALHGSTPSGSSFRAYQERLKNILENLSNDKNYVKKSASDCPVQF